MSGEVTQAIEASVSGLSNIELMGDAGVKAGETSQIVLQAIAAYTTSMGSTFGKYPITEGVSWKSSDPSIVAVNNGILNAIKEGEVTISASTNTLTREIGVGVGKDDLKYSTVQFDKDPYEYKAAEIIPSLTVTLLGETLHEDTDFSLSFSDNINAGNATVTLTGLGERAGQTKTLTFVIEPLRPTKAGQFNIGSYSNTYTGNSVNPGVRFKGNDGWVNVLDSDYKCSFDKDPVDVGTYEITVLCNNSLCPLIRITKGQG